MEVYLLLFFPKFLILKIQALLLKTQALGASGKMLQWFDSYLDRTQRVRHNGNVSTEQKFNCGIPQGSCLSPTLFIFYTNDVFDCIDRNINMMMFADDCVLYKSDLCCWGSENNMYLNASKTKAMLICAAQKYDLYWPMSTMGKTIQYVNTFNYLGVTIDDKLTFTPYYNLVKPRMENKIFVMSKIRKYIDNRTAILINKQAVLPSVEYPGFVLVSCAVGQRYEIQVLQNNASRLYKQYGLLDRITIDRLHSECKILGLEQRRRKQLLRLMYLHSKDDENTKKTVRITRAASKILFKVPTKCTGKYMNSPFYKGKLLWDNLSVEKQCVNNVNQFTKSLKELYVTYQEIC